MAIHIYILDEKGKTRAQILKWLGEDALVDCVVAFEEYDCFMAQVVAAPTDICIIRAGSNRIPCFMAVDAVLQVRPECRIVILSDIRKYAIDAFETGAKGYILCPVSKKKIKQALFDLVM